MSKRKRRPSSSKEKYLYGIYLGVLVGFSVFYFGYYLPYILSQLPPDNQLVKYDFPDNEWFDTTGVTITDHASYFQLPVSNDMLIFEIEYKNKKLESITIYPELDIRYAGKIVQNIATDSIELPPNESFKQRTTFYSNNTGLNTVTLNAKIVNTTNNEILDTISGTYYIRLFSQTDVFQSQLNEISNIGIFVSVGVAAFTIIISYISSRLTKRKLETDLDEKEKTLRPWIGVEQIILDKAQDFCRLYYHNYGRLPATSAKYKFKVSPTAISLRDMETEGYDNLVSNSIIFPNFDHTALIKVDKSIVDKVRTGEDLLFVGVLIEYRYGDEKMGMYEGLFEYKIEHSQFRVVDQQIK